MSTSTAYRDQVAGWDFGSLDLTCRRGPLLGGKLRFDLSVGDLEFGASDVTRVIAESLLQDGEDERITRDSNRQIEFRVRATGVNSDIAGYGEVLLGLELRRRNTIIYTPPDGGTPTRFVVATSWMDPEFKVWNELRSIRIYKVTVRALPFGFSKQTLEIVGAPSGAPPTSVDGATSAAAWSAGARTKTAVTYMTESAVKFAAAGENAYVTTVTWTGTVPSTAYVAIDVTLRNVGTGAQEVYRPGMGAGIAPGDTKLVGIEERPNGWRRLYYKIADVAGAGRLDFGLTCDGDHDLYVAGLFSAAAPASAGTMVFPVKGSARSPAEIEVNSTSGSLGWCIVYQDPKMLEFGYSPGEPTTWQFAPTGRYVLHAPDAGLVRGDLVVVTGGAAGVTGITNRLARDGDPLAVLDCGGGPDGRIGTGGIFGTVTINGVAYIGDVFAFRVDDHGETALTYTRDVTNQFLIQLPTLDNPYGGVWDDNAPSSADWEHPQFTPPMAALFVASSNYRTLPPETKARYSPAFATYATKVE